MLTNLENSSVGTRLKEVNFIPIPKESNVKECSNYHTIVLISHGIKVMLKILRVRFQQGFPDSLVGKESACNVGDPGLVPGSGISPGEGKSYPLQHSGLENSMDSPWNFKDMETTE